MGSGAYVTLADLGGLAKLGIDFLVRDDSSGEDVTGRILTQILLEEEGRGHSLLTQQFLRRLISFYGDRMQGFLPSYLELSLDSFFLQRPQLSAQLHSTSLMPIAILSELVAANLAVFDFAMRLVWPVTPDGEVVQAGGFSDRQVADRDDEGAQV